ncbi:MAG: ABC transporter permease [Solibacillus sp.]
MSFLEVLYSLVPSAIFYASPLIIAAIGGVFAERSGVVNIGLEGMLIFGAASAVIFNLAFADVFGDFTPWVALIVSMIFGALLSLILAIAAVSLRADQTVTGVAINMFALAVAVFTVKMIYGKGQTDSITERFGRYDLPVLSDIPILGKLLFTDVYITSILAFVIVLVAWFVIFKMPFGLRLRAVGEHPMAADTMGINVNKLRYKAVLISGALGGIAGAVYAQAIAGNFSASTIAGQGFMAIAAMIFGKWHPIGAMGAALFFGLAQGLQVVSDKIPVLRDIPDAFIMVLPYVLTILALAGFIGKAVAPKASGQPYIKGKR